MNRINRGAVPPDSEWVRLQKAAHSRVRSVMATVAAVAAVYVAAKMVYRLRDVLLLLAVADLLPWS